MSLKDISLKTEYRSLLDNVISEFYVPVLKQAVLYKRAVGFFSSSALIDLASGISGLVENGGKIQLIASPRLSAEDVVAINDGLRRKDEVIEGALLRELRTPTGKFEKTRLNLLSNLIAAGKLEIKIAFLETDNLIGMFHEKVGLMYDEEDNIVAFTGSMNESSSAFSVNYEAIDVYASWTQDEERVLNKQAAFNAMWNDYEPSIHVVSFPKVEAEIIARYRITDTIDTNIYASKGMPDNSDNKDKEISIGPSIPDYVTMRPYQLDAIKSWADSGYRGIFDMATGTGKTYAALAALAHLYEQMDGKLAVIIICPYQHLVEQWKEDILFFGMKPIVCYSASSQHNWRDRLKTAVISFNLGVQKHFSMVTTNATFGLDYVQEIICKLNGNAVIVVDEAHNFGAEHLSSTLLPNFPYRLALSATIDRHGDEEGTHLQALIAIRCLDEGVNIPSIRTAFIMASSTNPKEYIQRRGRVLRKFLGKRYATIFDFITLPIPINEVDRYNPEIISSTKALAIREIVRMKDFASIAENPFDSDSLISTIQSIYDIETSNKETNY